MKIVLISILFILFVSCNDSSERTTDVRMICFKDTNKEELKKENIKYEFVQLETTDESLLDGIFQIRITEDRLFIINQKFDKVLVFNKNGKFITAIGSFGSGPGEYLSPCAIHIDENNNRISIADRNRLKLLHYSLDSYQYLSSQPLFNFIYCTWLSDGNIAWVSTSGYKTDKRENYYVKITDSSLNLIGYLYPAIFTSSYGVSSGNLITEYGCNAYLCIPYLPDIQSVKSDCISPVYQFSFDSHHLPSLEWLKDFASEDANYAYSLLKSEYISAYNFKETDTFLFLNYIVDKGDVYVCLFDKEKNITYKYSSSEFSEITDLYGLTAPVCVYNNCFVAIIGPGELLKNKDKIHRSDIKSLTSKISDDDNPILIYFKFN